MEWCGCGVARMRQRVVWGRSGRGVQPSHYYSTAKDVKLTHYQTLGLDQGCSTSDIRDSFIRLSKELHPDTQPECPELHQRFIAVSEAYSVLSKPHLRRSYDSQLKATTQQQQNMRTYADGIRTNAPRENVVFHDSGLWEHRDKSQDYRYEGKAYYGVRGIKSRLPNSYIAAGAVLFMLVGGVFHFFLAKTSSNFAMEQLNRRDIEASQHHSQARQQAQANGNALQLTLLRQRIESNGRAK